MPGSFLIINVRRPDSLRFVPANCRFRQQVLKIRDEKRHRRGIEGKNQSEGWRK